VPALESLAEQWAARGVQSVFVYTREAHPGENAAPHTSAEDKLAAARRMRDHLQVRRPMLVDSLDGGLHRAYGSLPNMSFVVGQGGLIVYKSSWTDASHLDLVARRMVAEAEPLATGMRRVPFHVEWAPLRLRDDVGFLDGLLTAGPTAVVEYISAVAASHGEGAARRLRAWWSTKPG